MNDIQITTVDAPPMDGRGGVKVWLDRLAAARKAHPRWIRIGPFTTTGSTSTAKGAAENAPGNYEITSRTEDGEVWVYIRHLPQPKAVSA